VAIEQLCQPLFRSSSGFGRKSRSRVRQLRDA
jgi:hypothetical protein